MNSNAIPLRKPAPVGIVAALIFSLIIAFGLFQVWRHFATALQAYYLPVYARETLVPHLSFGKAAQRPHCYLACI